MNTLISKKELCDKLKLSESTVNRLMKKGMPYKKINRSVRYDEEEVKTWINNQSQEN